MIKLTPKQQEVIDSPARVKLVMGGMRSGKTALAIMAAWDMMKKGYRKVLFLVPSDKYVRCAEREIREILPIESLKNLEKGIAHGAEYFLIETDCGEMLISDRFIPLSYGGLVFDNATSSKHICPKLLEGPEAIYVTGHCPENMNNNFLLMWLKAYFSDDSDIRAFRLTTWENPSMNPKEMEWGERLSSKMGESNYNQQYLCIPDFTDYIEQNPMPDYLMGRELNFKEPRGKYEFNRHHLGKW
jgi:hypothetical protein